MPADDGVVDARRTLAQPTRQAPIAVVFFALTTLRGSLRAFGLFAIFVFLRGGGLGAAVLLLAVVGLLAKAVAEWWMFLVQVRDDELIVQRGVVSRSRTTVPLDRIQSVDTEQGLLQRLLGLIAVKVETAGSADTELHLPAASPVIATALQRLAGISDGGEAVTVDEHDLVEATELPSSFGAVLVRHDTRDLVRLALAKNPLPAIAVALGSAYALLNVAGNVVTIDPEEVSVSAAERVSGLLALAGVGLAVALTLLALIVVGTLLRDHDLTITADHQQLRLRAGLFDRRERVVPRSKVQLVRSRTNPVERRLGICALSIPHVGAAGDAGSLVVPGCPIDDVDRFVELYLDEPGSEPLADQSISSLVVRRWTLFGGLVPALVATAALTPAVGGFAVVGLTLLPIAYVTSRRVWRWWSWGYDDGVLIVERRRLTARRETVLVRKAQGVRLVQSLFERRNRLASVDIVTAAGTVRVPYIDLAVASQLRDRILFEVETSRRRWM